MEEIRKNLPRDVRVYELFNTSSFIKDSLTNLALTAGWGGVFVIFITLFFLRNIRNSIVVVVTIPFSLIIAFIFLYVFGFTINIISLASIAIGVGMVVDNAIVVLENIVRHVEKGERVREASVFAAGEVGTAISASTYTTVVIFLPLLFLTGFVGIIFKQLALAVTVTILASLFCALTLSPMLASKLMKPAGQTLPKSPLLRRLFVESENAFNQVESGYSRLLGWALGHKWTVLIIAGIALAVAVGMGRYVGTEFMPAQDSGSLDISYRLKVGTKVEDTLVVGRFIEETAREIGGSTIIHTHMTVGESSSGLSAAFGNEEGSHIGSVSARFIPVSKRKLRTEDYGQMIVEKVKSSQWGPYIEKVYYNTGNRLDALMSGSTGQPISMEVMGYDIDKAYALANQLRDIIAEMPGARNPTVSLELGKPELQIIIDRLKAEDVGADVSTMARDIDTLYRGTDISTFRKGSREYDIELRLAPQYRENTERIIDTVVTLRGGSQVVAATVAKMIRERGPVTIERLNRQRVIRVEASAFQRSLGEVVTDAGNKIKELKAKGAIPEGFSVEQGGSYKEQQKSFGDMAILLGMGIVLVFMVMASQFESIKQPFIIMFSVPFAFVGVVVILVATHTTLNLMSFIGAVLLVGVVVNNAIVLLDYTNILRARGIGLAEAIKQAGANRLRPVLMTTLTTIFGMLPLAVAPGEGSETWQPMAIAVIGGLSLSTLVTLVLIPVLYSIWERKDKRPVTV
jgi:HAE1 family hydrophobic/amphiphilic exporter-1